MTYLRPFHRLVVTGSLYTDEAFSYSLSLINTSQSSGARVTEVPQAVYDAVTTFHTSTGVAGAGAKVTTVKLNQIGTDGRYTSDSESVQHDFDTPVPGVGTLNQAPQVALAISLRTAKARGRAHSGRFYLPIPGYGPGSDGLLRGIDQQDILTAATTFIETLNGAVSFHAVGVVSNIGAGAENIVTNVAVGRVLDTIRSRRASLAENYLLSADIAGA